MRASDLCSARNIPARDDLGMRVFCAGILINVAKHWKLRKREEKRAYLDPIYRAIISVVSHLLLEDFLFYFSSSPPPALLSPVPSLRLFSNCLLPSV